MIGNQLTLFEVTTEVFRSWGSWHKKFYRFEYHDEADEDGVTLADWFPGYSQQQIDSDGSIQYSHGYAASENVYGGVGVAGVALAEAREDLQNGTEEGL